MSHEITGPEHTPTTKVAHLAVEAVDLLGLHEFIHQYLDELGHRLEECDDAAEASPMNSDMAFFAASLPVANGVIHLAGSRGRLREAVAWVRANWPGEPDEISTLSMLTLIYIIELHATASAHQDEERQNRARRLLYRVRKLAQDF